jgi:hypothetical protein
MMAEHRIIQVKALARVEGEGGLFVKLNAGQVDQVELRIYEPPRFFEAFLRGRQVEEVPDIVARICGICPVAYQMSAVHAIEQALGLEVSPEIRRLAHPLASRSRFSRSTKRYSFGTNASRRSAARLDVEETWQSVIGSVGGTCDSSH